MRIAIFGPKRSGKDTVAKLIAGRLSGTKAFFQFSQPLKMLVKRMMGKVGHSDESLKSNVELFRLRAEAIRILEEFLATHGLDPLTESEFQMIVEVSERSVTEAYRYLLQRVGTEIVRKRDKKFWTRLLLEQLERSPADHQLVTDGRFLDELEAVKPRALTVGLRRLSQPVEDEHVSEKEALAAAKECDIYFELEEGQESLQQAAEVVVLAIETYFKD